MKRLAVVLLVLLASADATAKVGGLSDAPNIRHQVLLRDARHELTPALTYTFTDDYQRNLILQIGYLYHFLDWLAVGAEIGYGMSSVSPDKFKTGLTEDIEREVNPEYQQGHQGRPYSMGRTGFGLVALAKVVFTPLSGKLILFGKYLGHVDVNGSLGLGTIQFKGFDGMDSAWKLSLFLATGLRFFPHEAVSIDFEVRDYLAFSQPINVTKDGEVNESQARNNFAIMFGLSVFLPVGARTGP